MGRFATAAIIAIALAGATIESRADDLSGAATPPPPAAAPVQAAPVQAAPQPAALQQAAPMPTAPHPGLMGWAQRPGMRPGRPDMMWRIHRMERTWGLFFNQRDKNLSNANVQVLAQAILLIHGNHDWTVVDVADAADGQATFAYATADGSVIARFAIDRHSGRLTRIG